jgi:hypothetical protein
MELGAAIKNYARISDQDDGIDAVSYLRTAVCAVSPSFLHEIFTDSQVSGLFLIPMLGAMTWYYLL